MTDRKPTVKEQCEIAEALARLLDKVAAGELTAPTRVIRRLEDVIVARSRKRRRSTSRSAPLRASGGPYVSLTG
jgi:hypothetical protein